MTEKEVIERLNRFKTILIPDDTCENKDIKTILTHEQFEANCYKVGGEDDEKI